MKRQGSFLLLVFAALAVSPAYSEAGIVNPSFETGDMTGWEDGPITDTFAIAVGGSDGSYCITTPENANWMPAWTSTHQTSVEYWHRLTNVYQQLAVPANATTMTFDVRVTGADPCSWSLSLTHTISPELIESLDINSNDPQVPVSAPNGFSRYTFDISPFAGMTNVSLCVSASQQATVIPTEPVEIRFDNLQIAPEPATLSLLALGGLLMLRRRADCR
jgi:hypothetical protein